MAQRQTIPCFRCARHEHQSCLRKRGLGKCKCEICYPPKPTDPFREVIKKCLAKAKAKETQVKIAQKRVTEWRRKLRLAETKIIIWERKLRARERALEKFRQETNGNG